MPAPNAPSSSDATGTFVTLETVEHGADPWCRLEWLSRPGLTHARELMMVRAIMPPGEGHKFHFHPGREEIIHVISGEAEQWIDREARRLGPGEIAHIPAGVIHATFNPGNEDLVFLAILSPVEADGEFTVDVFEQAPWAALLEARKAENAP